MLPGIASRPGLNAGGGQLTLEFIGHGSTVPADVQPGDLIIAAYVDGGKTGFSTPSGYTYLISHGQITLVHCGLAFKIADGSEGGTDPGETRYSAHRPSKPIKSAVRADYGTGAHDGAKSIYLDGDPGKVLFFVSASADVGYRTPSFYLDGTGISHTILRSGDGHYSYHIYHPGDLVAPSTPLTGRFYRSSDGLLSFCGAVLEIE